MFFSRSRRVASRARKRPRNVTIRTALYAPSTRTVIRRRSRRQPWLLLRPRKQRHTEDDGPRRRRTLLLRSSRTRIGTGAASAPEPSRWRVCWVPLHLRGRGVILYHGIPARQQCACSYAGRLCFDISVLVTVPVFGLPRGWFGWVGLAWVDAFERGTRRRFRTSSADRNEFRRVPFVSVSGCGDG